MIGAFSLAQIPPNATAVTYGMSAAVRLFEAIDRVPSIDSASEQGVKLDKVEGRLAAESIEFYYPSRPAVRVLHSALMPYAIVLTVQTTALTSRRARRAGRTICAH